MSFAPALPASLTSQPVWRQFRRSPLTPAALSVIVLITLAAVFAPRAAPLEPAGQFFDSLSDRSDG